MLKHFVIIIFSIVFFFWSYFLAMNMKTLFKEMFFLMYEQRTKETFCG